MPIGRKEFEDGKFHSKIGDGIVSFLEKRKERAFTSREIMEGMDYRTEFSSPETTRISTFTISDFAAILHDLAKTDKISMRVVREQMYFMARKDRAAHCPKCGMEIAKPRKTWKMAGRPDKKGKRLELHIGLFECPKHGVFRTVLGKRKISARARTKRPKRKKKKPEKQVRRKKTTKKIAPKKRRRKTTEWQLI